MAALDIWTAKKMLSADGELMRLLLMPPPDASDRSAIAARLAMILHRVSKVSAESVPAETVTLNLCCNVTFEVEDGDGRGA
jgi:hypothetical protein